jgi:2-keto-4-pentenoate hydratase
MHDIKSLAVRQLRDYDARTPGTVFAEQLSLSEEQAWALQSEVARLRQQRGESVVGYKVGCTSTAIQQQLGIDHPVYGRLFSSESWPSGTRLPIERFFGLAVEGELAVRLACDLPAVDLPETELMAAIETVFPVIELHNFVFRRLEPSAEELIANNAIHAGYVCAADRPPALESGPNTLRIEIDGVVVATVSHAELNTTVVDSLRWLAKTLRDFGHDLKAGQTILCGSVADLIPISHGCRISVTTDRFGSVECTIDEGG